MSSPKVLFGFHAVGVRLKTAPQSIIEIYYEATRRDARMRQFMEKVNESGVRLIEADGMRHLTDKTCDQLVSIPMLGAVESLNVSVASGICLYEAVRQRSH